MLPQSTREYYLEQQKIMGVVLLTAKRIWGEHPPLDFDFWWSEHVEQLTALAVAGQSRAIAGTEDYVSAVLAEMGTPVDPDVEVDPTPLVGIASDGRPLDSLMYGAIIRTKAKIGQAETVDSTVMFDAWQSGLSALLTRFQTQIADVARVATSLSIAARRDVGYVRMLNPPSCPKCAVLAGKFYRYNTGFLRHPGCDCRHIPSRENTARDVRTDPREYFDSLTAPEQDRWFTVKGAQAIRDGADINQVVNARRGLSVAGGVAQTRNVYGRELLTTTEGVTKRGIAGQAIIARGRTAATTPRLMPEAIYEIAEDQADALRLLQLNGYVLDAPPVRTRSKVAASPADDGTSIWQTPEELAAAKAAAAEPPVAAPKLVTPQIDANVVGIEKMQFDRDFMMIPRRALETLDRTGVEVVVARKVSESKFAHIYAGMKTSDGRAVEDVSFYQSQLDAVFISTAAPHGSVNVVAHEIGHALDDRTLRDRPLDVEWQEPGQPPVVHTVPRFVDDPYLRYVHTKYVHDNTAADGYYRTGSEGTAESGREEWIAEGYAAVVERNDAHLLWISGGSREAADTLKWTYRRMGVLP